MLCLYFTNLTLLIIISALSEAVHTEGLDNGLLKERFWEVQGAKTPWKYPSLSQLLSHMHTFLCTRLFVCTRTQQPLWKR